MLHDDRDNFAHIPDRYRSERADRPGPDADTLKTGDAGGRYACGVIRPGA
jgi:Cu-Zn family superoxide dismutase